MYGNDKCVYPNHACYPCTPRYDPCWRCEGPPGPIGPRGAAGPTGPTGSTGPAGGPTNLVDGNASGSVRGIHTLDNYTMGVDALAVGLETEASGTAALAEGIRSKAIGQASHTEGLETHASGKQAHAEGYQTKADGFASHTEGDSCAATGFGAHAEGGYTVAVGQDSHAEGEESIASGYASHAEGIATVASGFFSHSEGVLTSTNNFAGTHIMGRFGTADTPYSWFLANGADEMNPGLSAKILQNGNAYIDVAWNGGGADYAELYESESGQAIEPGYFVTFGMSGDKIRIADGNDRYVLGVVSAMPGFVAGAGELRWKNKFQTDKWGQILYQDVTVPELRDQSGRMISPAHVESRPALNPAFNPNAKYIPREKRQEWVKVGLLGMLLVRDDGTLTPGSFCRPGPNGTATAAQDGYKVLKRTDSDQALILFR